jgi:L-Lysine epsilon oxidase N-terminal/L-lysine epsilon oxidase C-terminal domain/Iron-containing redox enzyme
MPPNPAGGFKDRHGFIKRQAARFRVYGFGADGTVKELTSENTAEITWRVSLANKKASWYEFDGGQTALDIFEGRPPKNPAILRNEDWPGDRRELVIKSTGAVSGVNQTSPPFLGAIYQHPEPVYLGELRTDERGRLLVLGGHGHSAPTQNDEAHLITHYANNDGWYDDTSDGVVDVEVRLADGTLVPVKGRAWVIVAPPDFSPHTENLVTLFDVIEETALRNELEWHPASNPPPVNRTKVSFVDDVYPILRRVVDLQWVSARVARGHGPGKKENFLTDALLGPLADPTSSDGRRWRKAILSMVRNPNLDHDSAVRQANYYYMPQLAGDEGDPVIGDPDTWLKITQRQYEALTLWAADAFDGFTSLKELMKAVNEPALPLDRLPVAQQPFALTKGALLACVGGPFYPGIEMTSIACSKTLFERAFEISGRLEAGDITKWMALPWQADFFECNTHWWPAQRPDDVVSEYDFRDAFKKFEVERDAGALDMLLFPRKVWARGVDIGRTLRPSFDWPSPLDDDTVATFAAHCHDAFVTFTHTYWTYRDRFWRIPGPKDGESISRYQYRLREVFDRYSGKLGLKGEQWHFVLPEATGGELPDHYRPRVIEAFKTFINDLPPKPVDGESIEAYQIRLKAPKQTWNGFVASTTQVGYQVKQDKRGDNQMVSMWKELGFVVPARDVEQRVLIEVGRGKYEGLRDRDYFYIMLNYSEFPDFEPKARQLALKFLRDTKALQRTAAFKADPDNRMYEPFKYSPSAFEARLQEIYNQYAAEAAAANASDEGWRRQDVIARVLQLAPFNQLDGAWLRNATRAGPISDVNAFLFSIWSDETGNGDPALNHANLYTALLQSLGIYLPDLRSRAYADNPALFDSAFTGPLFQLVISQFSEDFFPEILGMTLQLEWEVLTLWPAVKRLERQNISTQFYRMHIGIDNADDGHGALAKQAVQQYLDYVRAKSGEEEAEAQWERIWNGYAAFATTGDVSNDMQIQRDYPPGVEQRILDLIGRKKVFAQLNHGNSFPKLKLGDNRLNDWFNDPPAFLDALAKSSFIAPGDPSASTLLNDRTTYRGPMYKVFTPDELKLWADWIIWLGKEYSAVPPAPLDPAGRMLMLVTRLTPQAVNIGAHRARQLTGTLNGSEIRQSVTDWFAAGPVPLMAALANPANALIVPGNPAASSFVTDILANTPSMASAIDGVVIDGKMGHVIINEWIDDGCKIPAEAMPGERAMFAGLLSAREGLYQTQTFGPDAVH